MKARPAPSDSTRSEPGTRATTLSAFERALRMLERRPHFEREVELKLSRAGYEADEIAAAGARLRALGYLDDATLAKSFAATLAARKRHGVARIRQELLRRGAPAPAVAAALAGADPEAELARAREAAERWRRRSAAAPDALARHLARKGFDRRVIFTVLKELASAEAEASGESFADD